MIYAISKEINIYKTIEKLFDLTVIDLVKERKKCPTVSTTCESIFNDTQLRIALESNVGVNFWRNVE